MNRQSRNSPAVFRVLGWVSRQASGTGVVIFWCGLVAAALAR